jgi:hypothetical protein
MQKKYLISFGFIAALLVASLLTMNTSSPAPQKEKQTCCKKTIQQCSDDDIKMDAPAGTTLENLSHQFIAIPGFSY